MLFKEVIGQEAIKKRLIQTVYENRVSHAQLFLGPEGSGKLALAIAYAQYINCSSRTDTDACGLCPSCIKYQKLIHPDLHFVYPIATTKEVTKKPVSKSFITDWRELLLTKKYYISLNDWYDKMGIENKIGIINADDCNDIIKTLSLKSYEAEYKVVIIWMIEKLYYAAAPKLLKILEEPPPKTLFILISEQHDQILNTILSRTQLIKIPKIDKRDLIRYFKENTSISEVNLTNFANYANGSAIEMFNFIENGEEDQEYFEHFCCLFRYGWAPKQYPELVTWVETISKIGREKQKQFLSYALRMTRECFIKNFGSNSMVMLNENELKFAENFAPFIKEHNVQNIMNLLDKAIYHIERNANPKILFLDLALQLAKVIKS